MPDTERLAALGIDAEEGLAYCADDLEFYGEMLAEYVAEWDKNREELDRFFSARDWANYRIRVHSVKNTSRMIGSLTLSERAHGLELSAKENDGAAIQAAHAAFITEYNTLVKGLRTLIG
ncbi:MAG: Hpt domain-containing protein [Clostridia bacterium]|nr:Hpt domain-containing protein [Clostridia bacterium]